MVYLLCPIFLPVFNWEVKIHRWFKPERKSRRKKKRQNAGVISLKQACPLELLIASRRVMAKSSEGHLWAVGTWSVPQLEGCGAEEGGRDWQGTLWSVCWQSRWPPNHSRLRVSTRSSRDGAGSFRQQHGTLPQRVKVNFYCTGTRIIIPPSPLSWAGDLQVRPWRGASLLARSSGQQGALAGRLRSTFFKGKREVSRWPKQSGLSVAILKQFL